MRRCLCPVSQPYLIFYVPHSTGIEVARILHGPQDIDNIFADDDP